MELKKGQKIALVTVGVIGLQSLIVWASYSYGSNDGFREARIGHMKKPTSDGTITIGEKGKVIFTPASTELAYEGTGPWNSKNNKEYIELQQFSMGRHEYGQWVPTRVASATCTATKTVNRWYCSYRVLSETSNRNQIVEVNPKTGDWQGLPQ